MRVVYRNAALATAALALLLAFGATAHAQNNCSAGKAKLAGKKAAAVLGCYSKASGKGLPIETAAPGCVAKASSKFAAGMAKLDVKSAAAAKPEDVCPAGEGDAAAVEAAVDAYINSVSTDLDPGFPALALSKCTAGKIKCAGKKDAAILGCYSKALGKGVDDTTVETFAPGCIAKATSKFGACFAKLDIKSAAAAKPADVCVSGTGDAAAIEAKVDHTDLHTVRYFENGASCPTQITFTGTSTTGVLDLGWTGISHDNLLVSDGAVTVVVNTCAGDLTPGNCGVCGYTGPTENAPGKVQLHRCAVDSSIKCSADSDCPSGVCTFYFGSYVPLLLGGLTGCVENTFAGAISGTADLTTGSSVGNAHLIARIFLGATVSNPCPRCLGDGAANDGVKSGTCSAAPTVGPYPKQGQPCDASGSSPNASFGTTSLDCPPDPGLFISALQLDRSNTTGNKTRTLSAASPNCSAFGWTTKKCQCDTCNDLAATPCASNADCTTPGHTICGGKRCIGGTNDGTPCANDSECAGGGACNVPGAFTKGNACAGGSGDCVPDGGNEHICSSGPSENFCGPIETFRGCIANSDCTFPGDTCSVSRFRKCFDNGVIGDVVQASGVADAPVAHASDPTLAAMSCVGPAFSPALNIAIGLPGLETLALGGHATDNGTP